MGHLAILGSFFIWVLWHVNFVSTRPVSTADSNVTTFNSTLPSPTVDLWNYLPQNWSSLCSVDYNVDSDVNATISCHVRPEQTAIWRLADLRVALVPLVDTIGIEVAVNIQCEQGGTISLPFPMRSPGLTKLTVYNCQLQDKYADFTTPAEHLPDTVRVLDMRNCVWLNNPQALDFIVSNLEKMSDHYECGQDSSLVTYIYRNISDNSFLSSNSAVDDLLGSEADALSELFNVTGDLGDLGELGDLGDIFNTSMDDPRDVLKESNVNGGDSVSRVPGDRDSATDLTASKEVVSSTNKNGSISTEQLLQTLIDADGIQAQCFYAQLEVQDESFSPITNRNHFEFLVKDSTFPKLRLLNYTGIGMTVVPIELRESRRKFPGSPLGVIDLSHNYIKQLGDIPPYPSRGVNTTIVLQYNNITKISLNLFQRWALVPDFFVDIRNNPIDCSCDLKDLLYQMENGSNWEGPAMTYYREQLSVITCATPTGLSGHTISSLTENDLPCLVAGADLRPVMVGVLVFVAVVLLTLVLAIKYREEVRVLMYTRVFILLPCGVPIQPNVYALEKTYDAFVAYAHQDSSWVMESLLKRLEEPGNSKGRHPCKLCIHHRDFVVGKPIIDNIIDSIAASRHTIVVLSKSFVQSGWAMEELAHAYRQSIEERRRHLVVVVLEDVPEEDMAPVLRRCCKTFTYLHVSDKFFWDRLLYSIHMASAYNTSNRKSSKKKTRKFSLSSKGEKQDPGQTNKGYDREGDEEEDLELSKEGPMNEEFRATLFSETMRTVSVDSTCSTVSDTGVPVSPSQMKMDRCLFDSNA